MLKKLFIKDYKNINDTTVRNRYGKVAGIFGIVTNLMLGLMKLIVGFLSNSVSIMADAANNLSDTASSIFTLIGFRLVSKKPNKYHPYGYARYEYVSGLIIAILMLVTGALFAKESVAKIISPEELVINAWTFAVLIVAVVVKLLQVAVYMDFSKSINSDALKTTALDARNDVISTCGILIALIVMKFTKINIDGYIGVLVSLFVMVSSLKTIKEVLEPLIGIVPSEKMVEKITEKIRSYDCVLGYHDLVIHNYGVGIDFVTVHIEIDSSLNMVDAHDLMDMIENDFKSELNINLTIHMDPVIVGDLKVQELKDKVKLAVKELDEELTIHDFRMLDGNEHIKVLFDCVVPHEKHYNEEMIAGYLKEAIKEDGIDYEFIVEIDRPFC